MLVPGSCGGITLRRSMEHTVTKLSPDSAPPDGGGRGRMMLWALLAVFFLASLPVLPLLSLHRGDERYYTDAAIRMVQTGDWITPYYADGSMRFRKPILPYWLVAVPFQLFGIGVASSRIGSLLAATAMLGLTYRLGMILLRDRRAAIMAVAVMASNEDLLRLSARATTDALQSACVMLALVGLAGFLFDERRKRGDLACFWIGIGLIAATKGGMALVVLAFALGMVLWRGRHLGVRLRDTIHWPAMVGGFAIGVGWLVAVLVKHGAVAWGDFWTDQVGRRVHANFLLPLEHLLLYVGSLPIEFLPWSVLLLIAVIGQWRRVRAFFVEHREQSIFVVAWLVVLLAIFSPANIFRMRYLLPAYPLVALWCSGLMLALCVDMASAVRVRRMILILLIATAALGVGQLATGWRFDRLISIGGGATLSIAAIAWVLAWHARGRPVWQHAVGLGVFVLLAMRISDATTTRPLTPPSGPMLAATIEARASPGDRVGAIGVAPGQLAQVRLLTGGVQDIERLPEDATDAQLARYELLLLGRPAGHPPRVPAGYRDEPIGRVALAWHYDDVVAIGFGLKRKEDVLARRSIEYSLARCIAFEPSAPMSEVTTRPAHCDRASDQE